MSLHQHDQSDDDQIDKIIDHHNSMLNSVQEQTITKSAVIKSPTRLKHFFPLGFRDEAIILLKITIPFAMGNILASWLIAFVSLAFIGHARGQLELNASALGISTYVLLSNSLMLGLNFGCDTLLPQCYGGNKKKMGLIVQRAMLMTIFACFIFWTLMLNAKFILKQIEHDQQVVVLADKFLRSFLFAVPCDGLSMLLQKYIASNEKTVPLLVINLIGNLVNFVLNYLFLYHFDLGIRSIPMAMTIAYASNSVCAMIYIRLSSIYQETWHPINRACLQEWGVYLKLSIPGIMMIMTEFWSIELSIIFAARLNARSLAAQVCAYQTMWLVYMVTSSFATAANIRIGQFLGAGKPREAANVKNVTLALAAIIILINITFIVSSHYWFPFVYNTDKEALSLARRALLLVAFMQLWDGYNVINTGIVKACGQQRVSALISFMGFYVFGIPVAILLMFYFRIDIYGFWLGVIVAETITNILLFILIKRFDWDRHAAKALRRIVLHQSENETTRESIVQTETLPKTNSETWFLLLAKKLLVLFILVSFFIVGFVISSVTPLYPE